MKKLLVIFLIIFTIPNVSIAYDLVLEIPDDKVQYVADAYETVYGYDQASGETKKQFIKRMLFREIRRICIKSERLKSRISIEDLVATETSDFGVE